MIKILIADDFALLREDICDTLNAQEDMQVVGTAESGAQAEKLAAETDYDVILMDIRMPVMDGLAATRCIRESDHPDSRTVPIVAMTANVFEEDVKKSFDAGMNAHLSKPVDIKQMYAVLDELVNGDGLL